MNKIEKTIMRAAAISSEGLYRPLTDEDRAEMALAAFLQDAHRGWWDNSTEAEILSAAGAAISRAIAARLEGGPYPLAVLQRALKLLREIQ